MLSFSVIDACAERSGAAPQVNLTLRAVASGIVDVRNVLLRAQVSIEATRRTYDDGEAEGLLEVFGEPSRWAETMRRLLWSMVDVTVPPFTEETTFTLRLPCSYDFSLASAKYFHALAGGDIPLDLVFSGTVFHAHEGLLRISQLPSVASVRYNLPVGVTKAALETHFPGHVGLLLPRQTFDRLNRYRTSGGHVTWQEALETLLGAEVTS